MKDYNSSGHLYDTSFLYEHEDAEFDHDYMDEDLEPDDDDSMFPRLVPVEDDELEEEDDD